jgi:hypothetical protein
MKFMGQDVFEVVLLELARFKIDSEEAYREAKFTLYDGYKKTYDGDLLWLKQAEDAVLEVCELATKIAPQKAGRLLGFAAGYRKNFDGSMKKPSGLLKILGGSVFQKSHPSPQVRPEIAIQNIKRIFILLNSSDYMSKE